MGQQNLIYFERLRGDFQVFESILSLKLADSDSDRNKVRLILNESNPGLNLDVPDPYYGGDQGFENVYKMLDEACQTIVETQL